MQELLQFMYLGEVNVKHSELQSFMKIAETLQIKGLTASNKNDRSSSPPVQPAPAHSSNNNNNQTNRHSLKDLAGPSTGQLDPLKLNSYLAAAAKETLKRTAGNAFQAVEQYPIHYPKKAIKRSTDSIDQESNSDCMDNLSSDEAFIPSSPQILMVEQPSAGRQFDLGSVKREHMNDSSSSPQQSPSNLATSAAVSASTSAAVPAAAGMKIGFSSTPTHHPALHPMFGAFDHNSNSFSGIANSFAASMNGAVGSNGGGSGGGSSSKASDGYPNDFSQDYGKNLGPGHMDIPPGELSWLILVALYFYLYASIEFFGVSLSYLIPFQDF